MGGLNVNRRRLYSAGSLGFGALIMVLALLSMTGTVYAALPLAGVGGFVIMADVIEGDEFSLIPNLHDTNISNTYEEVRPHLGMAEIRLRTVQIRNLHMFKNIDLIHISGILFGPAKYMQIVIDAPGESNGQDVLMDSSKIEADTCQFTNVVVDENLNYSPNRDREISPAIQHLSNQNLLDDPSSKYISANGQKVTPEMGAEYGLVSDLVHLDGARFDTHFLKMGSLTLRGMTLSIRYMTKDNQEIVLNDCFDPNNQVMDQTGMIYGPPVKSPWEM